MCAWAVKSNLYPHQIGKLTLDLHDGLLSKLNWLELWWHMDWTFVIHVWAIWQKGPCIIPALLSIKQCYTGEEAVNPQTPHSRHHTHTSLPETGLNLNLLTPSMNGWNMSVHTIMLAFLPRHEAWTPLIPSLRGWIMEACLCSPV